MLTSKTVEELNVDGKSRILSLYILVLDLSLYSDSAMWIRWKSGSKEKGGSNQHVAITKAIRILADLDVHTGFRRICWVLT